MSKTWLKPLLIFSCLSLLFFTLLGQIFNHCHPYNDLGIYGEALRLIKWGNLNPFIPGRFIHIFNDHFDPILVPFAYLERWIPGPLLGTTIEWLSVGLCWFPIQHLYRQQKIHFETAVFSYAFLILNHAMVDALFRPFHPTTWACLPLICTLVFYWLKKFPAMILSLVFLFACREEFPLLGIMIGLVLLWKKEWKWAAGTLFLSIGWTVFAFKIRPELFSGTTSNYGGSLLQDFAQHPFAQMKSIFTMGTIRMFLARTIPLLLLLKINDLKKYRVHFLTVFFITLPIFGIRFASNSWAFHYGTAPVIALWFMLLPALNDFFAHPGKVWRIRASWAFLLIIFFSPLVKNIGGNANHQCLNKTERLDEIKKAQEWILKSGHYKILLEGNLVATQMDLAHQNIIRFDQEQMEYHFIGGPSSGHDLEYEVVLAEKPPSGDAWPIGQDRMKALIELWKNSGLNVITDNDYLFLAEGKIKLDH